MADWKERAAERISGHPPNTQWWQKLIAERTKIIEEESAPVIDALEKESRRLKVQYDSVNKLGDLKQRDIKNLTSQVAQLEGQVEAMRPVVEHIADWPTAEIDTFKNYVLVSQNQWEMTLNDVRQARAVRKEDDEH